MSDLSNAARKTNLPILPNPLMPTLTVLFAVTTGKSSLGTSKNDALASDLRLAWFENLPPDRDDPRIAEEQAARAERCAAAAAVADIFFFFFLFV
jgi:hypothetical protein